MLNKVKAGMSREELEKVFELTEGAIHQLMKDGGELPFGECPECGKETLVYEMGYCTTCDDEINLEESDRLNSYEYLRSKND